MFYSIRMRAAKGGAHEKGGLHISGAERLLTKKRVEETVNAMIERAFNHSKGKADFINITIEAVPKKEINDIALLSIKNYHCCCIEESRKTARTLLQQANVSDQAVTKGMQALSELKKNMRGAMILCAQTGKRLDDLGNRGIRVSRMDVADERKLGIWLEKQKYTGNHIREAIVLASKVISHDDVKAELCWSDDPEYTTGYVATKENYNRINPLKKYGSENGGRVFFVHPATDIIQLQRYMEKTPVLVIERGKK